MTKPKILSLKDSFRMVSTEPEYFNGTEWKTLTSSSGLSGFRHPVIGFYKEGITIASQATNITYSTNTTITDNWISAKVLTINSGVTLTLPSTGELCFIFAETLVLNGTIKTGSVVGGLGTNGNYGGDGGTGACNVFIFAKQILGTGTINAAGGNGFSGTAVYGSSSGYIYGASGSSGNWLTTNYTTENKASNNSSGTSVAKMLDAPTDIGFLFPSFLMNLNERMRINAAGGGGASSGSGSGNYPAGGGGGQSFISNSGGSPTGVSGSGYRATGGGGGGGGGFVYLITESTISAITINASGGAGGAAYGEPWNYYTNIAGGGGGGGGCVILMAPSTSATVNVTGGASGGGLGTNPPTGAAGENGLYLYLKNTFV